LEEILITGKLGHKRLGALGEEKIRSTEVRQTKDYCGKGT
jgi:hypothetical protein